MSAILAFTDLETSGLEDHHEPWEFGFILRRPDRTESRHRFLVHPDRLDLADPEALRIGRFHERTEGTLHGIDDQMYDLTDPHLQPTWTEAFNVADWVRYALDGAVLIGSNAQFDSRMLRLFLARHGLKPTWHYRPVDVGAMAYGYLCGQRAAYRDAGLMFTDGPDAPLPWSSTELAKALGVERESAHEALPDAEFAMAVFDAVTGGGR